MPPWTLQELEAALPLFPSVSRDRLHELYTLWGGTVRWTLAGATNDSNERYLKRAIASSSVRALKLAMCFDDDEKAVSCKQLVNVSAGISKYHI